MVGLTNQYGGIDVLEEQLDTLVVPVFLGQVQRHQALVVLLLSRGSPLDQCLQGTRLQKPERQTTKLNTYLYLNTNLP